MQSSAAKWHALWTSYLLFVASAVLLFMFPPLLPEIRKDIPLDDVTIGWMQGLIALPAVFLAFIGGRIVDRTDSRISGIAAGLFMICGNLLFIFGGSLPVMLIGRFLIGVGSIIINLSAARMLTLWFPRRQLGLAMSVIHTAWPLAAGLSYNLLVGAGQAAGWVAMTLYLTLGVGVALLCFFFWAPRDPEHPAHMLPELPAGKGLKIVLHLPYELWITAVIWFCFTAANISILTFGATFLSGRGIDYATASGIIGMLMLIAAPASLVSGWIMDRGGSLKYYIVLTVMGTGICFFAFARGFEPATAMICAGLMAAFTPIAVYAMPGVLVSREKVGLAFGVILTFSNLGNTLGPVVIGWVNERSGGPALGMHLVAILLFAGGLLGFALRGHRLAHAENK